MISDGIQSPRAIALDPQEGLLFWTDWDKDIPRIESSSMTGTHRKVIFNVTNYKNGAWPNGLSLDYVLQRLYWIDARADSIHCANYDGSDHHEILRNTAYLSHPFSITVFESHVYWTDWRTSQVTQASKFNGSQIQVLDQNSNVQPCDIKIVHPSRQPKLRNDQDIKLSCMKNNGNCSHLCLINDAKSFDCACPHLMKLGPDGKTCQSNEEFFLIAKANEIRGLDLDNLQRDVMPPIFLPRIDKPSGLDFDAINEKVYWFDSKQKRIMRSNINGTRIETILDDMIQVNDVEDYEAFAIDYITGNIYFATQVTEVIDNINEMTSDIFVTNHNLEFFHTVIHKSPDPIHGLVLAPKLGLMFWAGHSDSFTNFNKAKMDGSEPEEFAGVRGKIHCLTYLEQSHVLYWINGNDLQLWNLVAKRLDFVTPSESHLLTCLTGSRKDLFYATDSQVIKVDLDHQSFEVFGNLSGKPVTSMRLYDRNDQIGLNPCSKDKKCHHLCLAKGIHKRTDYRCVCTIGYTYFNNQNMNECLENPGDKIIFTSPFGLALNDKPMESHLFRPLLKSESPKSFDLAIRAGLVFWIDQASSKLMKMNLNGSNKTIILADLQSPQRISIDYVTERIYWTDDKVAAIESCDFHGKQRYVLIAGTMSKPHAIAVDPLDGLVFWSDLGIPAKIEKSGLDGSNRTTLVNTDVKAPMGLTLDLKRQRLYWCDTDLSILSSVDFNGQNRNNLIESQSNKWLSKPIGVTYFENNLYWIDSSFNGGSISKVSTLHDKAAPELIVDHLESLHDIKMNSIRAQKGTNPCSINNAGCQEICLFNGSYATCTCAHGKLDQDGKSCVEYDAFILFSRVSSLESIHITDANDKNPPIARIESKEYMKNSVGLAFNHKAKVIYYSDLQKSTLNQVSFDGQRHQVLLNQSGSVEGLVFEHRQGSLYWTSNSDKSINRIVPKVMNSFQ